MRSHQKDKKDFLVALRILALVTGTMGSLPVWLILNPKYLAPGTSEFSQDMILFLISIFAFSIALYVWRFIYKQFKKDRTFLGFDQNKNGTILIVEIVIESLLTFLCFFWFF